MDDGKAKVEINYVPDDEELNGNPEKKITDKKKTDPKKKPGLKKIQEKIKFIQESLKKTIEERDEFKDKYLRGLAEIDNFRKRVKKEKEEYQKYILGEFLLELLQVFDNFERALNSKIPSGNDRSIISGIEMIYKQLVELFKKHNVTEIEALNKNFDPNIHQALSKEEKEGITEPLVVEVYQKGFLYNGKLLRPTLTKVAIPVEGDHSGDKKE